MSLTYNGNDCKVLYNGMETSGFYNGELVWGNSGWLTVDLNNNWLEYDVSDNAELSAYRCFYSNSNYHVGSSSAVMNIIPMKNQNMDLKYCSVAESSYDFFMFHINGSDVANTQGRQSSTSATIDQYKTLNVDFNTQYQYRCVYRKDGSVDSGLDRAYVLLEKDSVKEVING